MFFRQVRMGAGERTFRVFKFRTMVDDAESRKPDIAHLNMHNGDDPRMFKVPDDPRVTRLGRLLRRWRIDELPQLLNVMSGSMSLVGPRPLILDEDQHVVELGAPAPRPEARDHGSVAGARRERHPVRRDDEARLPLRHELVAARGSAPDPAHAACADARARRVLSRARSRTSGGGGIRTHEALARPTVFKTAPFDRSGTPPERIVTDG